MTFIRLFTLLAVVLSAAWFGSSPSWEPFGALVAAVGALLIEEHRLLQGLQTSTPSARSGLPADKALLEMFLVDFPADGALQYFASNSSANPFPQSYLSELHTMARRWTAADREFLTPSLEASKRRLIEAVFELHDYIGIHTFNDGPELQSISAYWPIEKQLASIEHIDVTAQAVFSQYQEFVRLARRVLLPIAGAA